MSEAGSRVKVTVRVRPPAGPSTRRGPAKECVEVDERKCTLLLEEVGLGRSRELRFDSVHGPDTSQSEFFKSCGITDLLDAALDGYTSTVFAFGQTGSGKTFTMSGKAAEANNEQYGGRASTGHDRSLAEGLMQRTVRYLYAGLAKRTDVKYMVRATYLEIYNEQVVDLIEPAGPLAVRGSSSSGFYVEDLSVVQCRNVRDLQYVVSKGLENRHSRHHLLNQHSSRSHAMFSVYLDAADADGVNARYGRISLLDLAGSENVRTSQSSGSGLKEAGSINRSLFALGQVIKTLSDGRRTASHVPYRDSNLTKLLADSLGGDAHTLMIACCSPLEDFYEETCRTMHYACSAGAIRVKPTVKLDPQQQLIARLRQEVLDLKQQVHHLQQELSISKSLLASVSGCSSPKMSDNVCEASERSTVGHTPEHANAHAAAHAIAKSGAFGGASSGANGSGRCTARQNGRHGLDGGGTHDDRSRPSPVTSPTESLAKVSCSRSTASPGPRSVSISLCGSSLDAGSPIHAARADAYRAPSAYPRSHVSKEEERELMEHTSQMAASLLAESSRSRPSSAGRAASASTRSLSERTVAASAPHARWDDEARAESRGKPRHGGRSARELELEDQLKQLTSFSAVGSFESLRSKVSKPSAERGAEGAASMRRRDGEAQSGRSSALDPYAVPAVARTRYYGEPEAPRATSCGRTDAYSHSSSYPSSATYSTSRHEPHHATQGTYHGGSGTRHSAAPAAAFAASAGNYANKAKALRSKEYELERSLRALSKFSATAEIRGTDPIRY